MLRRQLLRQLHSSSSIYKPARIRQSPFSSLSSTTIRAPILSSLNIPRRWQSTEAEKKPEEQQDAATNGTAAETPSAEDSLKQDLDKSKKEVIDLKDKYLRSVADYRNLQERTRRDQESARQFAIQRFATDLLDSVDNLDRAITSVPKESLSSESASPDLQNLHGGLKMTEQIMMQALNKHGVERFDPLDGEGRKFDPNQDEATFFSKQEGKEDGDVFYTQSKGFKLNGRVIRAAKVGVVKNS